MCATAASATTPFTGDVHLNELRYIVSQLTPRPAAEQLERQQQAIEKRLAADQFAADRAAARRAREQRVASARVAAERQLAEQSYAAATAKLAHRVPFVPASPRPGTAITTPLRRHTHGLVRPLTPRHGQLPLRPPTAPAQPLPRAAPVGQAFEKDRMSHVERWFFLEGGHALSGLAPLFPQTLSPRLQGQHKCTIGAAATEYGYGEAGLQQLKLAAALAPGDGRVEWALRECEARERGRGR